MHTSRSPEREVHRPATSYTIRIANPI